MSKYISPIATPTGHPPTDLEIGRSGGPQSFSGASMRPLVAIYCLTFVIQLPQIPTIEEIVRWGGYLGLFAIVFAETGLLIGFFLPGDSLLVTAGLFAASGELDILWLNILLIIAAVSGDAVGYAIGFKAGHALYNRPQSRFFRRDHLLKTKEFYEKYGGITIVMARFIPFARTFAPVVAGIAEMKYRRFAMFNIMGGAGWVISMLLTGYLLGKTIPGIGKHVEWVIIIVVLLSSLPIVARYIRSKHQTDSVNDEHS